MPASPLGSTLAAAEARDQKLYVALIANATVPITVPKPVALTIATTAVTGGTAPQSITITSATLPIPMQVGQELLFRHSTGSFKVKVTTLEPSGAQTNFSGIALEDIPIGAVAEFPTPLFLAQEYSTSDTTSTNTFSSFDHGGTSDSSRGESEQSVSFSMAETYYNSGARTLLYAKENEQDVTLINIQSNPDANAFSEPPIEWLVGKVTDMSRSGANGDKQTYSASITVDGGFRRVEPTPAP
jgi:hypothetical protein